MERTALYDDLGAGYDLIVNWDRRLERETPFYRDLFARHGVRRLLDVGCGTGRHARLFASWGLEVVGADPSQAMLDAAQEAIRGLPVQLVRAGFADLCSCCAVPFQAVVCLGNTLPHAATQEERVEALRAFHTCLEPGGVCVIQTLNYDHLAATRERFQPLSHGTADGREQLLLRMFDFGPGIWQFSILRFTRRDGGWAFDVSSTTHLPVSGEGLRAQLQDAGFADAHLLGGFDASAFDPRSSDMLLAVASKE